MKITIDTKEDSAEEIRNAIKILSHLVGEKPLANQPNIFENDSPEVTPTPQQNVFGNIFDSPSTTEKPSEEPESTQETEPQIEEKTDAEEPSDIIREYF